MSYSVSFVSGYAGVNIGVDVKTLPASDPSLVHVPLAPLKDISGGGTPETPADGQNLTVTCGFQEG